MSDEDWRSEERYAGLRELSAPQLHIVGAVHFPSALWLGVRPDRAFELSMLMSLPAVLGAVLLELPKLIAGGDGYGMAAVGALAAFGVGLVALLMLRRVVVRGHFAWFALWVLPLALATLALARAWPRV